MRAMKRMFAALSCAMTIVSVVGCSHFSDEPVYNVGYSYDLEAHEYKVWFKEDPRGLEEEHVVPLDYVVNVPVRIYPKHYYSSEEWIVVHNEYFKVANKLYIYSQI